jgi:hypothetical protein
MVGVGTADGKAFLDKGFIFHDHFARDNHYDPVDYGRLAGRLCSLHVRNECRHIDPCYTDEGARLIRLCGSHYCWPLGDIHPAEFRDTALLVVDIPSGYNMGAIRIDANSSAPSKTRTTA